jgi:hypothetical protein
VVRHIDRDIYGLAVAGSGVGLTTGSRAWTESAAEALRSAIAQHLDRNAPHAVPELEPDDLAALGQAVATLRAVAERADSSGDPARKQRVSEALYTISSELGAMQLDLLPTEET